MKMFSGSLIAIALLATFHTQDEVFAQSTTTAFATTSSQSAFVTSSRNATMNSTKHSSFPSSPTPTSVTGTDSSPTSETPTKPATSEIPDSPKTCGTMTVTIHTAQKRSEEDVTTTIQDGLFNNSAMYEAVEITNMNIDMTADRQIKVTFNFCLVFKSESGYIEDFAEKQFKMLFNATKIVLKLEESGVDLEWNNPAAGECNKCSNGAGGPFNLEPECKPKNASYSCNGLKHEPKESKECVKYCDDSGAVSIVASFFILPVGMAMSLSFYLWE